MKRTMKVFGTACLALVLAAGPAFAAPGWTSTWSSTSFHNWTSGNCYFERAQGANSASMYSGCDWYVYVRVKYNEFGTNYVSGWASGRQSAYIARDRTVTHQVGY